MCRPRAPAHCLAICAPASAPDVTLIGSEGFLGDLSAGAEPAALGMYVAYPGADVEVLPPAGKRFLKDLEARTGKPSLFYTASAAQATEILLDAIARSDGTRASVTRELFKTRVENGILGDIRFDKNGDPVEALVTIRASYAPRARRTAPSPTEWSSADQHCFAESRLRNRYGLRDHLD